MRSPRWARAVSEGDADAVRAWLASGADVNARDRYGQTALMLAAHGGHAAIVDLLITSGADLDVTAKYNLSATMLAVVAGHPGIARRLVAAGADRTIAGRGAPGFAGKTAYHLALDRGMDELTAELAPR